MLLFFSRNTFKVLEIMINMTHELFLCTNIWNCVLTFCGYETFWCLELSLVRFILISYDINDFMLSTSDTKIKSYNILDV